MIHIFCKLSRIFSQPNMYITQVSIYCPNLCSCQIGYTFLYILTPENVRIQTKLLDTKLYQFYDIPQSQNVIENSSQVNIYNAKFFISIFVFKLNFESTVFATKRCLGHGRGTAAARALDHRTTASRGWAAGGGDVGSSAILFPYPSLHFALTRCTIRCN